MNVLEKILCEIKNKFGLKMKLIKLNNLCNSKAIRFCHRGMEYYLSLTVTVNEKLLNQQFQTSLHTLIYIVFASQCIFRYGKEDQDGEAVHI